MSSQAIEITLAIIFLFKIFTSFAIGVLILGVKTAPTLHSKKYRLAKLYVCVVTALITAQNVVVMIKGVVSCAEQMFSIYILALFGWQACLFACFAVKLFHSSFATLRNLLINFAPTLLFVLIYSVVYHICGDQPVSNFAQYAQSTHKPALLLRTAYAIVLVIQYANYLRIFLRDRRLFITNADNNGDGLHGSDFCFGTPIICQAVGIGVSELILCLFPNPVAFGVLTVWVTVFYITIAIRYINSYTVSVIVESNKPVATVDQTSIGQASCAAEDESDEKVVASGEPQTVVHTFSDLGNRLDMLILNK